MLIPNTTFLTIKLNTKYLVYCEIVVLKYTVSEFKLSLEMNSANAYHDCIY